MTIGGIAGIACQTPAWGLVDRAHHKRALIAGAVFCLCIGALALAFWLTRPVVWAAAYLMAGPASIFLPAVAAITLGLVGHRIHRRQGRRPVVEFRRECVAALSMGLVGKWISPRWPFYLVVLYAIPTLMALWLIRPGRSIMNWAGRATACSGVGPGPGRSENRPLVIFAGCAVLFHFANAAMLPLLGEMLSAGKGASAWLYMSACVITTQAVVTVIAWPIGRLAGAWGRKPMLLIGFAALPIRGILFAFTHRAEFLVAIQVLDGIGARRIRGGVSAGRRRSGPRHRAFQRYARRDCHGSRYRRGAEPDRGGGDRPSRRLHRGVFISLRRGGGGAAGAMDIDAGNPSMAAGQASRPNT